MRKYVKGKRVVVRFYPGTTAGTTGATLRPWDRLSVFWQRPESAVSLIQSGSVNNLTPTVATLLTFYCT
jgi:hypothetical protein